MKELGPKRSKRLLPVYQSFEIDICTSYYHMASENLENIHSHKKYIFPEFQGECATISKVSYFEYTYGLSWK
jgi:hypothetical protein